MATKISKENPGRNFEVIIPQLGIWRKGQVFSEFQFRQLHPAPKPTMYQEAADVEPAEDYYKRMIDALLSETKGDGINIGPRNAFIRVVADREADPIDSADIASHNPRPRVNPMVVEALKLQRDRELDLLAKK